MINAILGIKIDQSQTYNKDGSRIPVTRIFTGTCCLVAVKTADKDGYSALQLGLAYRKAKNLTKPELGHLTVSGLDKNPPRFLKEIKVDPNDLSTDSKTLKPGDEIKSENIFQEGDTVQVTGISKGKGFQGVVKRHHFKGGPRTHGQSDRERAPGAIGQTTTPGRVYKGKRMAGRMGNDQVTVKNVKIIGIDTGKNILTVSGLVPGGRNALLVIRKLSN